MYLPAGFNIRHVKNNGTGRGKLFFNILAFLIVAAAFILMGWGFKEITAPVSVLESEHISLAPVNLFEYSFRTTLRMFIAMIFSLIFSLIYATIAAKSRRAEQILVPLLDVLQSVPILGYISFTVTGFLLLFPNSVMGAELAAIFAIFTSQVWNMTFSFYQSLKTVPTELIEASIIFKMSRWQRFWRLEVPFGVPSMTGNIIISMSGGWFFVVASEVINVGNNSIILPGIGSYISLALAGRDVPAILYAITAMTLVIILYDQLILRPLVAWSGKFRYETSAGNNEPKSWVLALFRKNLAIKKIFLPLIYLGKFLVDLPLFNLKNDSEKLLPTHTDSAHSRNTLDYVWYLILLILTAATLHHLFKFLHYDIGLAELLKVFKLVSITLLRVFALLLAASLVWAPLGIYIGSKPGLAAIVQPLAQFFAAFPANLLFPVTVIIINHYQLNPNIWLSPLMIIGAQWYILFNVIAGSSSFPNDLKEVGENLNVRGWLWLRKAMLPAITPYFVTGAITASGGAWNASIVAEVVSWGNDKISAVGIGSYIADATLKADFHRLVLGISAMSLCVVLLNKLFWQPLYNFTIKKYRF